MTAPALAALIADFTVRRALRAGSFIVTVYGDVILPRGGSVWIGNVIATCAQVGINESQSRTAISRLVEAGRLIGVRAGRRSFYRLTKDAALEFAAAARAIHGAGTVAADAPWTLVLLGGAARAPLLELLARRGFGVAATGLALKPGDAAAEARALLRGLAAPPVFTGPPDAAGGPALARLAAEAWDLAGLSAAYTAFAARFAPLEAALAEGARLAAAECLVARLLLVHDFRRIALRDPALPTAALPPDWAGAAARRRFQTLYRRLTPAAEGHVTARFVDIAGPVRPAEPRPAVAASDSAA